MELDAFLHEHGITAARHEHPAVMTVEESERLVPKLSGAKTKDLFLARRKGDGGISACTAAHDAPVDVDALGAALGVGGLRFASPERLQKYLGLTPGASAFSGSSTTCGRRGVRHRPRVAGGGRRDGRRWSTRRRWSSRTRTSCVSATGYAPRVVDLPVAAGR